MALLALKSSGEHQVSLNPMMGKKSIIYSQHTIEGEEK